MLGHVSSSCCVRAMFLTKGGMRTKQMPLTTPIGKPVTATNPMSRRKVGGREWRMTLYELIESERAGIAAWWAISNRHVGDAETQRLCVQGLAEAAERLGKLNELVNYKGEESNGNGQHSENPGGA